MDLKFYLSRFLRHLPYFLILAALGTVLGLTLARVLPPVYLAEARLVVENEQIPGDLAASTVQTEASEQIQIIQQRILTRDTLIEMANRLQIYPEGQGRRMEADDIVEDLRARISIVLTGGKQARGPVEATIVTVGFEAETASLSATVTNELVTLILAENVKMRTNVARQTLDFFDQEVKRLDQDMATRGAEILKFKEANQEALPDSLEFRRGQQAAAQERLLQLGREAAELRDRRERMVRLHEAGGTMEQDSGPRTPEATQLQTLRDELARTLVVLSPENPKVKILQGQIATLEKVVAAQAAGGAMAADGRELSAYEIQLADLDGQIRFNAAEAARVQAEMDALGKSIAATPANAIALETMERDYTNLRLQYDHAVANRARAELGDVIEALSKGQRISVIEQATPPRDPVRPNRLVIAAAGIGGGIAAGLALVLLREVMNGAIRRPADLTAALGITPLATLPFLRTERQARRRRLILIALFAAVLLAIPLGLWAIDSFVTPLDLLIENLRRQIMPV